MNNPRQRQNQDSITSFREQFDKMLSNWPVSDTEIRKGKAELFREVFDQFGGERFAAGVQRAIKLHYSPFFPTVGEFTGYIPERKSQSDGWTHTAEEWRAIRAEQNTPEFHMMWTKFMKRLGVKEIPWTEDLAKTVKF